MPNINWTDLIPMGAHYKHPLVDHPMATTEAQLKLFIAEGLNPHRHLSRCQCDNCRNCVRLEDKLGEYSSEEALSNVGLY